MVTRTFVCDGNFYLHKSWSISARTRRLDFLEKNTLTLFLTSLCNDAVALRATHVLVTFDSKRSWRHDLYPEYKENRNKGAVEVTRQDGSSVSLDQTAGSMVKAASEVCTMAGLTTARKKGYEGDDLIGGACVSLPGIKIIGSRDKDLSALLCEDVHQYWPVEKLLMRAADVRKKFGVDPSHIAEFLALMGDKVDNIPGIPGVADKTAAKWLNAHGSIRGMLKDEKIKAKLKPYRSQLEIAKKLTTLKCDVHFKLDDLIPQPINTDLNKYVWQIPPSLKELSDVRIFAGKKGLFGK